MTSPAISFASSRFLLSALRASARWGLLALALVAATGCKPPRPAKTPAGLALAGEGSEQPQVTLVWVGVGRAERLEGGVWRRVPQFDYEFSVEQRRYPDRWESTKTMRRRHPEYDGSAGPRVQSYLFQLRLAPGADDASVAYQIASSLGRGAGRGDREFRSAVLEIDAETSFFAPFDRYRITQQYQYEAGKLIELVELNDGTSPWVRNHEEARLYSAASFAQPPTRFAGR